MTSEAIKERIQKTEERIEKKQKTIEKKTSSIEKKKNALKKLGIDYDSVLANNNIRDYQDDSNWYDIYWTYCDINHYKEDIERGSKEIEELKILLNKYNKQLESQSDEEDIYNSLPSIILEAEKNLIEEWDKNDKEKREFYRNKYNEYNAEFPENSIEGYKKFIKEFKYPAYEDMRRTDKEIHDSNVKIARAYIIDFVRRVKEIVGEISDCSKLYCAGPALNGYVQGNLGRASVETILAGGYNIQRLHCRTLVKEIR